MKHRALALVLALMLPAAPAAACGPDSDCALGDRSYRIYLPQSAGDAPMGALIFAHGYKGSAAGTMRNASLIALADRLGIALVAANAAGDDWLLPNAPSGLVDTPDRALAYFDALRADILARHAIDPARLVFGGFSAGGMVTWTLACHRPGDYAGFLPIAGTFWAPVPDSCATPVAPLVHIHGTADRIVPMSGRAIGPARQGQVGAALDMYRRMGRHQPAPAPDLTPDLTCEGWQTDTGTPLVKCLHSGAHRFRTDYVEAAWRMLTGD